MLAILWCLSVQTVSAERVVRVVDGDTLVMQGGEKVRLVGIDTPERGEPFYSEAAHHLEGLVAGHSVDLARCAEADRYGRTLALITSGGTNVNLAMIRAGLASPLLIPPCGKPVAKSVLAETARAVTAGMGIYSSGRYIVVKHREAARLTGRHAVVVGTVNNIHVGRKAVHLNFGEDWRNDFTAVLFKGSLAKFDALGLEPLGLVGRKVMVLGKIKDYNGPEIIVRYPDQLIPLEGEGKQP